MKGFLHIVFIIWIMVIFFLFFLLFFFFLLLILFFLLLFLLFLLNFFIIFFLFTIFLLLVEFGGFILFLFKNSVNILQLIWLWWWGIHQSNWQMKITYFFCCILALILINDSPLLIELNIIKNLISVCVFKDSSNQRETNKQAAFN